MGKPAPEATIEPVRTAASTLGSVTEEDNMLCIECNTRTGHQILDNCCTRCARDHKLYVMRAIADETEKAWADYADVIYRVEVFEGERVAPATLSSSSLSDRPTHDVQGEPAMGSKGERVLTAPMKQVRRSTTNAQDMTDE